jgi:hypothetical protein
VPPSAGSLVGGLDEILADVIKGIALRSEVVLLDVPFDRL